MQNIKITFREVTTLLLFAIILTLQGCSQNGKKPMSEAVWKQQIETQLPLLGHRNWILIVDKAFPLQTTDGVSMIYAEEELLDVLKYTLGCIEENNHIKPVIYKDKELAYINEDLVPGIDRYRSSLAKVIGQSKVVIRFSDFMVDIFGEREKYARAAVEMASLSLGASF